MSNLTASERAYRLLHANIVSGRYEFGERLNEIETSEALGVSRTPLRDALRRLSADGLVQLSPRSGAQVASWTTRDVADVYELRIVLEPYGARRAAARIEESEVAELAANCRAEAEAIASSDFESIRRLNAEFHHMVMRYSGNGRLVDMTTPLISVQAMLRTFRHYQPGQMTAHQHDHEALVEALASGNPDLTEALMRAHLIAAKERLMHDKRVAETTTVNVEAVEHDG